MQRAVDNAAVSDPDEYAALPQPRRRAGATWIRSTRGSATATDEQRIELALAVEAAALAADPRVKTVEDTMYADGDGEVFLASTAGVRGSFRADQCYAFAYVLAEQDGQVETGYSYSVGRAVEDLDPDVRRRRGRRARRRLLGASKCPSMKAPVVLDPFVSAAFFGVLSSALTADAVQKGRSLFAGREGQQVAGELLELVDDGTLPDGLASAPFDGEGVPCRRTPLIARRRAAGLPLRHLHGAQGRPRESTGNGVRGGYSSLPGVRPTNLVRQGPATPVDDIVAGIEHGVLVTDAVGIHSGANPISGEFSVGISGVLIEDGQLTTPVREVTLAGDIVGMLTAIAALGDDARWVPSGSILTPSVVIDGMAIGGT